MTLATVPRYTGEPTPSVGDRAVVLGGSIAGLCAGRVLADLFEEVVIVEKNRLPDAPTARSGAPQTHHPHVLLEAGRVMLEDLFPGFCETVLANGGVVIDIATEMRYYDRGAFLADAPARLPMYCASRPLFEQILRQRVRNLPNVRLRDETSFSSYRMNTTGTRVTGAVVAGAGETKADLSADLVVDATGRWSDTPEWLADHGYRTPTVDEVSVDVTYSTIRVERKPDEQHSYFVPPTPPRTRGAAAIPIEDDQWEIILQGVHGDATPSDRNGVNEFVDSLPVDELATLTTTRRWTTETVHRFRFPSSRWYRYERLHRFPKRLVVIGDAVASFNPIYGQGMSVAALEAVILYHLLTDERVGAIGPAFFERASDVVDAAWKVAVGTDFDFDQTAGPKPRGTDLFNRYIARLVRQAHTDGVLTEAFYRVFRLEQPPKSLLRPRIAWRVLRPTINNKKPVSTT